MPDDTEPLFKDMVRPVTMGSLPFNRNYPADAGQCDGCGGWGCSVCDMNGWLPQGHEMIRTCANEDCEQGPPRHDGAGRFIGGGRAIIPPSQVAVYCSNECAAHDA